MHERIKLESCQIILDVIGEKKYDILWRNRPIHTSTVRRSPGQYIN